MRGDAFGQLMNGLLKLGFGNEAVYEAQFQSAFRRHSFSGQDNFKRSLRSNEKRQNRGGKRREYTDGNFRLRKARFRRGNHQVAKSGQLRAAADGRAVHHANHRLAHFEHAGEGCVKRVEHLENALRGIFADVDAAAKYFTRGIEDDEFDLGALAGEGDAIGEFAKHAFIKEIVFGTVQRHTSDAAFDAHFHVFELIWRALPGS